MNNSQNKTMDEIIVELQQNVMELKIQYEKEFSGDSGNVTGEGLPSLTEALKLRETMNEIKKIYDWNDEMDTDFIGSVIDRETIFVKYYECPDIKEKYVKLEEENEELKKSNKIVEDENAELTHDNQQLQITDSTCLQIVDLIGDELPDSFEEDDILSCIKQMKDADAMWRLMAHQQFGGDDDDGVWSPGEVSVEIDILKGQIPAKKGKKLSKDDKGILNAIYNDIDALQGLAGGEPGEGEKLKLLKRLLK